jgi:SAM-dependent methyltransferase
MGKDFDLDAGTRDLYRDPLYYDHEYKQRVDDANFYAAAYVEAQDWVLELGVGSGRIATRAVRRGAKVVGLDLSADMLRIAQQKKQALPKTKRAHLQLVRADMRAFAFDRQFKLISCPFNAFQHLYTRDDVERCLACIKAALAPDGRFCVDMLMPDPAYFARPRFRWYGGTRYRHPRHGDWYTYSERSSWDGVRQLNQMWFRSVRDPQGTGPEEIIAQLSHRYFSPTEIEALLHYAGFGVVTLLGDFDEGPLSDDSESMVVIAEHR